MNPRHILARLCRNRREDDGGQGVEEDGEQGNPRPGAVTPAYSTVPMMALGTHNSDIIHQSAPLVK